MQNSYKVPIAAPAACQLLASDPGMSGYRQRLILEFQYTRPLAVCSVRGVQPYCTMTLPSDRLADSQLKPASIGRVWGPLA